MSDIIKQLDKDEYDLTLNEADVPCTIKIGGDDIATDGKFVPNINASKWDNEVWLNINHPDVVTTEKESLVDGKLQITIGNNTHRYFVTDDGTLEYEIEFAFRPVSNIVTLNLDLPDGLEFTKQPDFKELFKDAKVWQPDKCIGSYAVYWNKCNNQHKTGKFCHIYRPKLVDANGEETWADICLLYTSPSPRDRS